MEKAAMTDLAVILSDYLTCWIFDSLRYPSKTLIGRQTTFLVDAILPTMHQGKHRTSPRLKKRRRIIGKSFPLAMNPRYSKSIIHLQSFEIILAPVLLHDFLPLATACDIEDLSNSPKVDPGRHRPLGRRRFSRRVLEVFLRFFTTQSPPLHVLGDENVVPCRLT